MPKIPHELGYRKITDIDTQNLILSKIKEKSHHINPKIWFGCELLSLYLNIRPKDLLNLIEGDIDIETGTIIIRRPTKKRMKLKIVKLDLYQSMLTNLSD